MSVARFNRAFSEDNPFSLEDDKLRQLAKKQIAHLQSTIGKTSGKESQFDRKSVILIGDGTKNKPSCSYGSTCKWDGNAKQLCAQKLCEASGYSNGKFISASNNPCESSATDSKHWYYYMDHDEFSDEGNPTNEAFVKAKCW